MGIPSYFNLIIKNYINIFEKLKDFKNIDNLYFDSNSIIYECLRKIDFNNYNDENNFINDLLLNVTNIIDNYIQIINPRKRVFITFDGVAPMAKLQQQRTRRHKNIVLNEIEKKELDKPNEKKWDTSNITPGTQFMDKLNKYIKNYYENIFENINNLSIMVSGSNEFGEGEHKIFQYIRDNQHYHSNTKTFIYGLDADLIILCLSHIHLTNKLYLFREIPEYDNNLKEIFKNEDYCILNIEKLAFESNKQINKYNLDLNDYILLSFFIGNDFLPHFPSINIRNNGLTILLETYKNVIKKDEKICNNGKINWKILRKFVNELSKNEENNLKSEYKIMDSFKNNYLIKSNNKLKSLLLPCIDREKEDYIDVYNKGWEERYYDILLHINDKEQIKKLCINYLEGLEWNLSYYTYGCKNYRWCYNYNYPPLFKDLIKYIPYFDCDLLNENYNKITPLAQLSYVLPYQSLYLLPNNLREMLLEKIHYNENYELIWAFCRYLWESHINLEFLDINKIEKITNNYYNNLKDNS